MFEPPTTLGRQTSPVEGGRAVVPSIMIFALGNPLRGDDGVGPAILEALQHSGQLTGNVVLLDGDTFDLMTLLVSGEFQRIFIVDAVDFGGAPGEWVRENVSSLDVFVDGMKSCSNLHHANLFEVLALGRALGIPLPEIVLYGIQPLEVNWSQGLSRPVQEAVQEIARCLTNAC